MLSKRKYLFIHFSTNALIETFLPPCCDHLNTFCIGSSMRINTSGFSYASHTFYGLTLAESPTDLGA